MGVDIISYSRLVVGMRMRIAWLKSKFYVIKLKYHLIIIVESRLYCSAVGLLFGDDDEHWQYFGYS